MNANYTDTSKSPKIKKPSRPKTGQSLNQGYKTVVDDLIYKHSHSVDVLEQTSFLQRKNTKSNIKIVESIELTEDPFIKY